ncbi:MAG: MFS transporter [Myxococcota bacterium]|nr:MFS transporter [Myxococcota bacterium]
MTSKIKIESPTLRVKEKFGYALGDFACDLFFMMFIYYGLFFYTDVFGIPAAVVGTMFLVTKLWDTVNDPIMGIIADRTKSKWGKYRPYLLWAALPFGIAGFLTFTSPNLGLSGKIVYAYITYTLMMMAYTAVNIPYSALMGVLTPNSRERTSVSTYRFAAAFAGGIFIQALTFPLIDAIGGNSDTVVEVGESGTGSVTIQEKGIGTVQLKMVFEATPTTDDGNTPSPWLAWLSDLTENTDTIEKTSVIWVDAADRLQELLPVEAQTKTGQPIQYEGNLYLASGFGQHTVELSELFSNKDNENKINWQGDHEIRVIDQQKGFQWTVGLYSLIAMVLFIVTFTTTKERVHPPVQQKTAITKDLINVLTSGPWWIIGVFSLFVLAQTCIRGGAIVYYFKYYVGRTDIAGMFMLAGTVFNLLGVLCTDWLTRLVGGKKRLLIITTLATVPMLAIFYFLDRGSIAAMFLLTAVGGFLSGPVAPIFWAMYADIADYSEWLKGSRATGLFFSAATFSQKMGWTLGGAAAGWLLAWYGFEANVSQNAETIGGIKLLMSWIPAAGCLIAGILVFFYKLDDKFMARIETDLENRRKKNHHELATP